MNLSEAITCEFTAVVHKGREVPELKEAVLAGEVTLSKAKKICSVITPQNKNEWIELAKCETSRVIEMCVARANPKEQTIESAKYTSGDRLEFKLGVSDEWFANLKQVKDLLSQKFGRNVDSEEALGHIMKDFIQRNDPVLKAERAMASSEKRAQKQNSPFPGTVNSKKQTKPRREKIKRITFHQLNVRDGNQCTHVGRFGRCEEKRWLDTHHIVEVTKGGTNALENLTTLCRAHHQAHHFAPMAGQSSTKFSSRL